MFSTFELPDFVENISLLDSVGMNKMITKILMEKFQGLISTLLVLVHCSAETPNLIHSNVSDSWSELLWNLINQRERKVRTTFKGLKIPSFFSIFVWFKFLMKNFQIFTSNWVFWIFSTWKLRNIGAMVGWQWISACKQFVDGH